MIGLIRLMRVTRVTPGPLEKNPDGASPFVEGIQHVGFAEIDPNRPSAWPLRIVAIEVAVDAVPDDLGRNATLRPTTHQLESRPDDPNQVAVILPAEVGFDVTAILIAIHR